MIVKKFSFLWIILLSLNWACWSQIDTVSIKSFGLNGKIASITDYSYLLRKDSISKDFSIDDENYMLIPLQEDWNIYEDQSINQETNVTFDFNKIGKNTKITYYFTPGKSNETIDFIYDKENRVLESKELLTYNDGSYAIENIYTYDSNGRLVKSKKQQKKRLIKEVRYLYDNNGHMTERIVKSDNSITEKEIRDFEKNNLVFENLIIPNKERKSIYKYNKGDKMTYLLVSYPEHGIFHETDYEYTNEGMLKKASHLNDLQQETICLYEYEKGRLIKEKCYDANDEGFMIETERKYNRKGKSIIIKSQDVLLEKKEYGDNGYLNEYETDSIIYTYKYKYDKKGNWTQIIQYEDGKPLKLRTREIKYY